MVDFGALPPEVNSARMYAGPGASSFQVAASAWNGLAAELQSAAQGYETTITQLASDEWNGPASAAMSTAAQPYIGWMQETAAQAEQAATQAQAAVAAYEQAFAATVPPPLVAANRAETAAAVQAGFVWINEVSKHFLGAPFGGYKQSGIGREECMEEMLAYTQEKNIHVKLKPPKA